MKRIMVLSILLAPILLQAADYEKQVCQAMTDRIEREACLIDLEFQRTEKDPCRIDVQCWGKRAQEAVNKECNYAATIVNHRSFKPPKITTENFSPDRWIRMKAGIISYKGDESGIRCTINPYTIISQPN